MSTSLKTHMGDGIAWTPMTADVVLKPGWQFFRRLHTFDPDAGGRKVTLPDARELTVGSPIFILLNINGTHSILVEDNAGGVVDAAFGPDEGMILGLADNTTQAGTWYARTAAL